MFKFHEFFAGGGMARAGLGDKWRCDFANDIDPKKCASYRANWGGGELFGGDVNDLSASDLPGDADLAWASFPCQDISLAGGRAGLAGARSGSFWPFWRLMQELVAEGNAPTVIVLENVCGLLTANGGKDFGAICGALEDAGYRYGALVIDAVRFVPQSRPRLFIVGVQGGHPVAAGLINRSPSLPWHTPGLVAAVCAIPLKRRANWTWWSLPEPPALEASFADLVEDDPSDVAWATPSETRKLVAMMNDDHLAKVAEAKRAKRRMVGTVYKRTRVKDGEKVQRAEVRFDDIAGCLRVPTGGSSRQTIVVVEGWRVRSRLISARETARLMGLDDGYILPSNYNAAYHLTGDGVVVPVVRYLARHIIEPLLSIGVDGRRRSRFARRTRGPLLRA
jgi:DNA (cytosine-5)-methyltransferase 1